MVKSTTPSRKKKLHEIIYEADTPAGKAFDVILLIVIVLSIIMVMLESVKPIYAVYADLFYTVERIITIIFITEYILRTIAMKLSTWTKPNFAITAETS